MFEGMAKNVTCLGFYDNGHFMYSGGEDCMARIWDLRYVAMMDEGCLVILPFTIATAMSHASETVIKGVI